ncbi:unnamed protein product, partial [Closterium sp. NIES-54]
RYVARRLTATYLLTDLGERPRSSPVLVSPAFISASATSPQTSHLFCLPIKTAYRTPDNLRPSTHRYLAQRVSRLHIRLCHQPSHQSYHPTPSTLLFPPFAPLLPLLATTLATTTGTTAAAAAAASGFCLCSGAVCSGFERLWWDVWCELDSCLGGEVQPVGCCPC